MRLLYQLRRTGGARASGAEALFIDLMVEIVQAFVIPNSQYSQELTTAAQVAAREAVEPTSSSLLMTTSEAVSSRYVVDGVATTGETLSALLSQLFRAQDRDQPCAHDEPVPGAKRQVSYQRERVYRRQTINEKIEGWFRVCEAAGLDGSQGVLTHTFFAGGYRNNYLPQAVYLANRFRSHAASSGKPSASQNASIFS